MTFLKVEVSRNGHAEYTNFKNIPPGSTIGRQRTRYTISYHWAQDQCSDIEYEVLSLEKLYVRDKYNATIWE